jgi:threonine dehydratase
MPLSLVDIRAAAGRIAGRVLRSPSIECPAVSRECGATVLLKLDNLQATGAFKERGAPTASPCCPARARGRRHRHVGRQPRPGGRPPRDAGRHRATIVMPRFTPANKVLRTEGFGARVVLHGETLAEAGAPCPRSGLAATASPSSTPMTTSP